VSRRGRGGRKLSGSDTFPKCAAVTLGCCAGHSPPHAWHAVGGGGDVQCDGEALRQAAPCHGRAYGRASTIILAPEAGIKKLWNSPGQLRMIEWDSIETAVTRVEE
jgi:hypothetical protein